MTNEERRKWDFGKTPHEPSGQGVVYIKATRATKKSSRSTINGANLEGCYNKHTNLYNILSLIKRTHSLPAFL